MDPNKDTLCLVAGEGRENQPTGAAPGCRVRPQQGGCWHTDTAPRVRVGGGSPGRGSILVLEQGGWDGISLLQAGLLADDCSACQWGTCWDKRYFCPLHSQQKAWSSAVLLQGVCRRRTIAHMSCPSPGS